MIQNTSGSTIKSWSSQVQVPVSAVPSQKPSVQPLWSATSHLVRNIAFDLGPKNIRVNGIAPGATRTDALKSVLNDDIEKKCWNTPLFSDWASPRTWPTPPCFCAHLPQAG